MTQRTVTCPQCGKKFKYDKGNPWRPFCSERCRLIDLGSWLDGSRRIPTDEPADIDDMNENSGGPVRH